MSKLGNFSIFVLVTTLSITSIILFIPLIIHSLSLVLAAAAHLDIAPIKNGRIMVLYDATLIDGTGAKPRPHTVIILNEGKISSIVEKNQYQISVNDNRQIINLSGRYIIPGLFDMHAHVASVKASSYNQTASINMLRELLQWGITTIRNPGGPTEEAVMLKKMVNSGQLLGPHVFTAGNLINSMPPTGFVETMV